MIHPTRRAIALLTLALGASAGLAGAETPTVGAGLRWARAHPEALTTAKADDLLPVLVRFHQAPTAAQTVELEASGLLRWRRSEGEILRSTTVLLARVHPDHVARLAQRPELARVELDWRPGGRPPLDLTAPLCRADEVWGQVDDHGIPLTGAGVTIADLDTGIDYTHPAFFRREHDPVPWFDEDGNGLQGTGGEWVDLDLDGERGPDETLRWIEAGMSEDYPGGNPAGFTPGLDWAYADADQNGGRDTASEDNEWDESSPSLGEPILVAEDLDSDGRLDPGEPLYPLGASKVRAIRDVDGRVYRRDVDLLEAPRDAWGHGTPVGNILAGGEPGFTRLAGFAPGADLLMAEIEWSDEPRFWTTMPEMATWAAAEGADVILIEDGEWVWEFMDGSSAGETLLTELATDQGIVVLTAAGNLAGGGQHDRRSVPADANETFQISMPPEPPIEVLWINTNWRGGRDDMSWTLVSPVGIFQGEASDEALQFPITGGLMEVITDSSHAGTHMFAFRLQTAPSLAPGDYRLTIHNRASTDALVDAFKWDDRSGWGGVSRFVDFSDEGTVTWPGTAHGLIVVGAYSPREGFFTPPGELNTFSGRGRALDGRRLVDLAAPGSYTFSAASSSRWYSFGAWIRFSGTSAALPHAAGTVALLLQAEPESHPQVVEHAMTESALSDTYTGNVPNATWGYGKLDAAAALELLGDLRGGGPGDDGRSQVRTGVQGRLGPPAP